MRNPARTASTAAALMIGLALVTPSRCSRPGSSSRSIETRVTASSAAITCSPRENGFTPTSVASGKRAADGPGRDRRRRRARRHGARLRRRRSRRRHLDPDLASCLPLNWKAGSNASCATLGANGAIVDKRLRQAPTTCSSGRRSPLETPAGRFIHLARRGDLRAAQGGDPLGAVSISSARFDADYPNPQNVFTLDRNIAGGVTRREHARARTACSATFPDAKIQTEQQFINNQEKGINTLLNLLYVLLALSIIVSLFGIVNTLVLTVFERTRELGMLRAVGMTRRQTRRMIRHESVITALHRRGARDPRGDRARRAVRPGDRIPRFTIPVGTIIVFVIAAIIVGLLAAIFPARRASRLNVLKRCSTSEALQYEWLRASRSA